MTAKCERENVDEGDDGDDGDDGDEQIISTRTPRGRPNGKKSRSDVGLEVRVCCLHHDSRC